jgi:hypothetical protein
LNHGHTYFLRSGFVHFIAHNRFDIPQYSQS